MRGKTSLFLFFVNIFQLEIWQIITINEHKITLSTKIHQKFNRSEIRQWAFSLSNISSFRLRTVNGRNDWKIYVDQPNRDLLMISEQSIHWIKIFFFLFSICLSPNWLWVGLQDRLQSKPSLQPNVYVYIYIKLINLFDKQSFHQ